MSALLILAGLVACSSLRKPDVVFLTIDTLRFDHVDALTPLSPVKTPAMDALVADGVAYTQAWSPISVTGPAFTSLMTGQEPGTTGVVMNQFNGSAGLPPQAQTLAEALSAHGFSTAAFVSGFTLRHSLGLDQGFDRYDTPVVGERRRPGLDTARQAVAWLRQRHGYQRLFLWVHSYDPHGPLIPYEYAAPVGPGWARDSEQLTHVPAYQRIDGISDPDFYRMRYAAAVGHADAMVGQVVGALKESGRYDNALIVLLADHGETMTERPLWFDHGTAASAEQLHVPLVIKYPHQAGAGTKDERMVSLVDVAPTVLSTLGLDPLPAAEGQPLSVAVHDYLVGESSHCKHDLVLPCAPLGPAGKELALRTPRTTLLRSSRADGVLWVHFDRSQDPDELRPLRGTDGVPAHAALLDQIADERAALPLFMPSGDDEGEAAASTEPGELENLRALGYVDPVPSEVEPAPATEPANGDGAAGD